MIFLKSHDLILGIIIILKFTVQVFAVKDDKNDVSVKASFVNMLRNIVDANESRIHALKRIIELQDYMVTKTRPTFLETDTDESSENENAYIAILDSMKNNRRTSNEDELTKQETPVLYIPAYYYNMNNIKTNYKETTRSRHIEDTSKCNNKQEEHDDNLISDINNGRRKLDIKFKDTLVQDPRRSNRFIRTCAREGKKLCKEACKIAYRSFCRVFSCSSRAKRKLRIECKYSCNAKFKTNTYSDDDTE